MVFAPDATPGSLGSDPSGHEGFLEDPRHEPVPRFDTRIDGYPTEHLQLQPPVLILAAPQPGARVSRGRGQRRLGNEAGTADRTHPLRGNLGGSNGPLLPLMTNDTP